jgi:hypothetical protein
MGWGMDPWIHGFMDRPGKRLVRPAPAERQTPTQRHSTSLPCCPLLKLPTHSPSAAHTLRAAAVPLAQPAAASSPPPMQSDALFLLLRSFARFKPRPGKKPRWVSSSEVPSRMTSSLLLLPTRPPHSPIFQLLHSAQAPLLQTLTYKQQDCQIEALL